MNPGFTGFQISIQNVDLYQLCRLRVKRVRRTVVNEQVELKEYQFNYFTRIQKNFVTALGFVQDADFIVEPLAPI